MPNHVKKTEIISEELLFCGMQIKIPAAIVIPLIRIQNPHIIHTYRNHIWFISHITAIFYG